VRVRVFLLMTEQMTQNTIVYLGRHQGVVANVVSGALCIRLDNGRSEDVELGKQAIRLIAGSKGRKR